MRTSSIFSLLSALVSVRALGIPIGQVISPVTGPLSVSNIAPVVAPNVAPVVAPVIAPTVALPEVGSIIAPVVAPITGGSSSSPLSLPIGDLGLGAILSNGTSTLTGSTASGLSWISSGLLSQGCQPTGSQPSPIADGYTLSLLQNPVSQLLGSIAKPTQVIQFVAPAVASGSTFLYSWKYLLSPGCGTSSSPFDLTQLVGDNGAAMITLSAISGSITIKDNTKADTSGCPSVPISSFTGRTLSHALRVTAGAAGRVEYIVKDAVTNAVLLTYLTSGNLSASATLKFGLYRETYTGMTPATAQCGDFSSQKM